MPKFPVQILAEIEAPDREAAYRTAEAACTHLQETFMADGSTIGAFTVEESGFEEAESWRLEQDAKGER